MDKKQVRTPHPQRSSLSPKLFLFRRELSERERERERKTERQRQTDRQTDRQTKTDRQREFIAMVLLRTISNPA